jgi:predicted dehydrogenase
MLPTLDRRQFLELGAAAGVALGAASTLAEDKKDSKSAADKIVVGVMGVNGRGSSLAKGFAGKTGSEVAYVCDVDERALDKTVAMVAGVQQRKPQAVVDFRKILDDKSVDALVIAAPDHWHAPATILGCSAGKHVYVEKPCSHNAREGEMAVEAARKNNRVVQMGTQRRSYPSIIEAVEKVRGGEIGRVLFSRTWYNNRRTSIGKGKAAEIPSWLNYALWQGPAPEKPYRDNVVHYNWHWFWHWGTGELGNNGVHALDICRWGLAVDYPSRVVSAGGKFRHDDDQETPDTHVVTYEFEGGKAITWEGLSWSPRGSEGEMFGINFHGDEGTLVLTDKGYKIYDMKNKELSAKAGSGDDSLHLANFLACIRDGRRPTADIEEGHKTTLLCHLGNISHRVGRAITTDPKNGRVLRDDEAQALWGREYRQGWEPKV